MPKGEYTTRMPAAQPKYPFVTRSSLAILAGILSGRRRSFRSDACAMTFQLKNPIQVQGSLPDFDAKSWLIVCNHYSRPGFGAWWIPLGIAAIVPHEMHWIVTAAWRFDDPLRSRTVTPLSRWFLQRVSRVYGFTCMPPMPPHPQDIGQRARSVRAVLRFVETKPHPVLGLSPEGADSYYGDLQPPPRGMGRFAALLAKRNFHLLPIGVFEQQQRLCLSIGEAQKLPSPAGESKARERQLADFVMRTIAACLPSHLRGPYA